MAPKLGCVKLGYVKLGVMACLHADVAKTAGHYTCCSGRQTALDVTEKDKQSAIWQTSSR